MLAFIKALFSVVQIAKVVGSGGAVELAQLKGSYTLQPELWAHLKHEHLLAGC